MPQPLVALALTVLILHPLAAGEAPYGASGFYPSPERPIGYKGDGTGHFPGATVVREFWEGDPQPATEKVAGKRGEETQRTWTFAAEPEQGQGTRNLVWRVRTPAYGNSAVVAVGDRIITIGLPYDAYCYSAHDGKLLWTTSCDPWQAAGLPSAQAVRLLTMENVLLALLEFPEWSMHGRKFPESDVAAAKVIGQAYISTLIPAAVKRLQTLDAGQDYAGAGKVMAAAIADFIQDPVKNWDKYRGDYVSKGFAPLVDLLTRRISAQAGFKARFGNPWGPQMGPTMPSPTSDGEFIWFQMANGPVTCLDLNGKVVWAKLLGKDYGEMPMTGRQDLVRSPMLVDGVLVVVNQATHWIDHNGLFGLDAKTGKTLWRADVECSGIASDKVVTLLDGGKPRKVVVGMRGWVVDPRDGALLWTMPAGMVGAKGAGRSSFSVVDFPDPATAGARVVLFGGRGDAYSPPIVGVRLAFAGGRLMGEKVWSGEGDVNQTPGYCGYVAYQDRYFIKPKGRGNQLDGIIEGATGKGVANFANKGMAPGESSVFAFGDLGMWPVLKTSDGPRSRDDRRAIAEFAVWDLSTITAPKLVSTRNVLGHRELGGMPWVEALDPELAKNPDFCGSWGGAPGQFFAVENALTALGNRLFIRSAAMLYCIGDPAQAFSWDPASRPAAISARLKP